MEAAKDSESTPSRRARISVAIHGIGVAWLFFCAVHVVPQFDAMFKEQGGQLPSPTEFLMSLSAFVRAYWFRVVPVLAGLLALDMVVMRRLWSAPASSRAAWYSAGVTWTLLLAFGAMVIALFMPLVDNGIQHMGRH